MDDYQSKLGQAEDSSSMMLESGARVGVIGGGPAGSFFSYFLLDMAQRAGLDIHIDIFEPRDFARPAPQGCNMCGGIISESLVQYLATEGINLPPTVVQRGIDSYMMHMDVGSARIDTPLQEKRIGAVHRGAGPRNIRQMKWASFDGHLQSLAVEKGAQIVRQRVRGIDRESDGRLRLKARGESPLPYDLVTVAAGVNTSLLKLFENLDTGYQMPQTAKTAIREYYLGEETIEKYLGSSMLVFLLDLPRLEFAAAIPKGDYVTVCLMGTDIDDDLLREFMTSPQVSSCFPPDWSWDQPACHCAPRLNIAGASHPYGDRLVFLGDCGETRLYKDGIGAAYRVAKAAAVTVIFEGVAEEDFARHYRPACQNIKRDNRVGQLIFFIVRLIQKTRFARRAVLLMVSAEQKMVTGNRRMSTVLWDTFTGSAPYREVFKRTLHPLFLGRFLWSNVLAVRDLLTKGAGGRSAARSTGNSSSG